MSEATGNDFWRQRAVFVTGHTGFKGSWLSQWLLQLGAEVHGFALPPPPDSPLFEQLRLPERLHHKAGDINDAAALDSALRVADPEVVFHLAAQPLVRDSYRNPLETYRTNVMGTAHLLDACRRLPRLKAVVVITTDKCYENHEWHWGYRENEALGGYDPYSSSKACAELVAAAYRRSFFGSGSGRSPAQVATARAGNVIGGGDWARDRLIPDAVRAFRQGAAVAVRYPQSIRPWQHVLESLSGYLCLAEHLYRADGAAFAEAWNFGPGESDAWPVARVMDHLCSNWPGARWEAVVGDHPHEAGYLKLDCAKAHAGLGWHPRLPLDVALAWSLSWYRADAAGEDMVRFTDEQIRHYQALN